MRYAVFLKNNGSKLEQVLEYFHTLEAAKSYARGVKRDPSYTIMIGEFI